VVESQSVNNPSLFKFILFHPVPDARKHPITVIYIYALSLWKGPTNVEYY
jgi:hypothetical protein